MDWSLESCKEQGWWNDREMDRYRWLFLGFSCRKFSLEAINCRVSRDCFSISYLLRKGR